MRKATKTQMPSGEAQVLEREAVTLGALFAQRDRLRFEVQQEIRRIQETINALAGDIAVRARWPKTAPDGGRYEFMPASGGEGLVMRFVVPPKAKEEKKEGKGESGRQV